MTLSLKKAKKIAQKIFKDNTDYSWAPYMDHLEAVSDALEMYDEDLQVVGLFHSIMERTEWTEKMLLDVGLPEKSVATIKALTHDTLKQPPAMYFRQIRTDEDASLVKIACTAHNNLPERLHKIPMFRQKQRMTNLGYAQRILWPSVYKDDLQDILEVVNPDLLAIAEQLRKDEKL